MALTGTKGLMIWCQRSTEGYSDVRVVNMTTSFRDGLAFCAIIHHFRPDLINFDSLTKDNVWENNQLAFEVAEKELNIPSLLDPDDMVALPVPDKLSIMTYASQYYNCFKNKKGAVELGIKTSAGVGRTTVKRPRDEPNPFKGKEGGTPAKKAFPANSCQICGKKVYLVEKVVSNNNLYHRSCFKCKKCGGTLRPGAAKVGTDPSHIECQHHQDKIWNLRTNMSNRLKHRGGENDNNTIWESKGGSPPKTAPVKATPDSSPKTSPSLFLKKSHAKPFESHATPQHPVQKPPPIPPNPPSKSLHPHLGSISSARAQFFTPTPEEQPPPPSKVEPEAEKNERVKAGLITTLAGVMSREEERKKQEGDLEGTKWKSGSTETPIDEPSKPDLTTKTSDVASGQQLTKIKPALPCSKPMAVEEKRGNLVSQRISMFSDNNIQEEIGTHEPVRGDVRGLPEKEEAGKVPEKQEEKLEETDIKKPELKAAKMEDKTADTKPIFGDSSGVKGMISKMEQEQGSDEKVSGEGMGEVMEGVDEGESATVRGHTPVTIDTDRKDTMSLDMERTTMEVSEVKEKPGPENGSVDDECNPFLDGREQPGRDRTPPIDSNVKGEIGVQNGLAEENNPFLDDEEALEREGNAIKKNAAGGGLAPEGSLADEEEMDESNPFLGSDEESIENVEDQNENNEKMEITESSGVSGDESKLGIGGEPGLDRTVGDREIGAGDSSQIVEKDESKEIEDHKGKDESSAIVGRVGEGEDKASDKKSEKSKDSDLDYDDSLNPFGSDDDDDEDSSSEDSDSDLGPNNPFAESDGDVEEENYDESLNPFGDDDDEIGETAGDSQVNPFTGSPIEDTSSEYSPKPKPPRPPPPKTTVTKKTVPSCKTRQDVLQEMKRARNTLKQKKPAPPPPPTGLSPGSQGTGDHIQRAKSTKSRRAPLPPGMTNGTAQHSGGEGSPTPNAKGPHGTPDRSPVWSQRSSTSPQVHRPGFKPPPQPQWKMSAKRRAPAPPPQKRNVRKHHVTPAEIQQEIAEIEANTKELERKGIELEDRLRAEMRDDKPEDSEELLMEWFEVVNEKNQMVRREGELVAQAQIQDLEIQHAEVEYEMRCLMHKQEHQKTDEDVQKEDELLELLVALVQQRSTIVDRLEEDRIREQEEDETIRNMMQMKGKLLQPDLGLDRESVEQKKEKKKKKKKKKHKEKHKDKDKHKEKDKGKDKVNEH